MLLSGFSISCTHMHTHWSLNSGPHDCWAGIYPRSTPPVYYVFFCFGFGSTGAWTQDLTLPRQAPHPLNHYASPTVFSAEIW
jgi:hypothetical protein